MRTLMRRASCLADGSAARPSVQRVVTARFCVASRANLARSFRTIVAGAHDVATSTVGSLPRAIGGGLWSCTTCGVSYRTDFARCPNDGGALALTSVDP